MTPPADEELQTYFNEHQSIYQEPARFTFTQVFIDPDKRGDATLADAEKIKATLIVQGDAIENAGALGDSLMLQSYYPENDKAAIQRQFGSGFADSVTELSPGQWHGSALSGYGVHLRLRAQHYRTTGAGICRAARACDTGLGDGKRH